MTVEQRNLGAVKHLCLLHVLIRLFKSIECTTPRMNGNVNCGLWVTMTCPVGSSAITHAPLWWGRLEWGGSACVGVEGLGEISAFALILQ